jgi:hypothetical protein
MECTLTLTAYLPLPFTCHTQVLVTHPSEGGQQEGVQMISLWRLAGHLTAPFYFHTSLLIVVLELCAVR